MIETQWLALQHWTHACCNNCCNERLLVLQQIVATVCLCCNNLLQQCARVARNRCIKPLQHTLPWMMQHVSTVIIVFSCNKLTLLAHEQVSSGWSQRKLVKVWRWRSHCIINFSLSSLSLDGPFKRRTDLDQCKYVEYFLIQWYIYITARTFECKSASYRGRCDRR